MLYQSGMMPRRLRWTPSCWKGPVPVPANCATSPCRMANCAWFSRSSFTFSVDPAEEMAATSIPCEACSLTFATVAIATPTG